MQTVLQVLEYDRVLEKLAGHANSILGAELCLAVRPMDDVPALRASLAQTTELRAILDFDQAVPFSSFPDLRPVLKKLAVIGSSLSAESLVAVGQTCQLVRRLSRYFAGREEKIPHLKALTAELLPLEKLEKEISRCIDEDSFDIRDEASEALASIRRQIIRAQANTRRKMEGMVKSFSSQGVLQENLITMRNGRMVLVIKDEYKRKVQGLVHDRSASGLSYFIEPFETVEDNNRVRELLGQEAEEIERILARLSDLARSHREVLQSNFYLLGRLDLVYAKAAFSRTLQALEPEIVEETLIYLAQARHPLLLLRMGAAAVTPMQIELGREHNTVIISGPNAGGKTVALKTVGLLVLMARSGLHIPASPLSQIGSIDRVFAVIGDQQSIEADLSTFSSHLLSLKEIDEQAGRQSLVLMDEIGAGTDPEEGMALATALLKKLTVAGALSMVTTHHSVLKTFAYQNDQTANASMEFDLTTLKPTYRFRIGIPGSSYAFEIARRIGVSEQLIAESRSLVGEQKDRLEGLILELEAKIQRHQKLAEAADLKEAEYRGLAKLYHERTETLRKEEKQLKRKAAEEAQEILASANSTVEQIIREIKSSQAETAAIRAGKQALAEQRTQVEKIVEQTREEPAAPSGEIKLGDLVLWKGIASPAVLISEPDKQGRVLLQADGLKLRAPFDELTPATRSEMRRSGSVRVQMDKPEGFKTELDLRGQRADEALENVERFFDEALLVGFHELRIIHGKGAGKLRSAIKEYLRAHPAVKQSRLGNWNEGDSGVTIVELK